MVANVTSYIFQEFDTLDRGIKIGLIEVFKLDVIVEYKGFLDNGAVDPVSIRKTPRAFYIFLPLFPIETSLVGYLFVCLSFWQSQWEQLYFLKLYHTLAPHRMDQMQSPPVYPMTKITVYEKHLNEDIISIYN